MPTISPKETVTITRFWHEPKIHHEITVEKIAIGITLEDYLLALAEEVGNPTLLLTKLQLKLALQKASRKVIEAVKAETSKVV